MMCPRTGPVYTMETACNSTGHVTVSCTAKKKRKDPGSEAEVERKGHNILIMSPKEKNGDRVLQAAAAQS